MYCIAILCIVRLFTALLCMKQYCITLLRTEFLLYHIVSKCLKMNILYCIESTPSCAVWRSFTKDIKHYEELLTIVEKRTLQWQGRVTRASGLSKTILQGTVQGGRRRGRQMKNWTVCLLFVGCLTSQQHASVSQGRICTDNFTCCHTEIEAADQTFHLTQSQYTDTGPTSPSADPITPGA